MDVRRAGRAGRGRRRRRLGRARAVDDARTSERAGATTAATTGSTTSGATTGDAAPAKRRTYTVRTGETLSDIAERFDTTVTELVRLNPDLDPDAIQPGQRIRVS